MGQRAVTRKELKELTRQRLVDGTIDIMRAEGVAAATTGRIAEAAGIKQSSFYGHFADRDACLEAAAEQIGSNVLERVQRHRTSLDTTDLRGSVRRSIASVTRAFMAEPELTRIFLRYRADDESPLGRAFRALVARARHDLQKDLRLFGVARSKPQADAYAEMLVSGTLGLIEGLIDGRLEDRDVALDAMADVTCAALTASLARTRKE